MITGSDPHAIAVFDRMPSPKFMINTLLPLGIEIHIGSGDWSFVVNQEGRELRVCEMDTISIRRPALPDFADHALPPHAVDFARRELQQILDAIQGLRHFSDSRKLFSQGKQANHAANKVVQLVYAQRVGMKVPKTCITNIPTVAKGFCREYNAVYKTLGTPIVDYGDGLRSMIYTSRVKDAFFDGVALAPCLFQENIEKSFELRVAVVGETVIPIRLNSQGIPGAEQDWRHEMMSVVEELTSLPQAVESRLVQLHQELGLNWGMVDMIVTDAGEYVFLETNPDGAWLWVEDAISSDAISQAIANYTARKNK